MSVPIRNGDVPMFHNYVNVYLRSSDFEPLAGFLAQNLVPPSHLSFVASTNHEVTNPHFKAGEIYIKVVSNCFK